MSTEEFNKRSEDSLIRIWAPILVPVIGIAIAWGTMTNQLSSLQTTQQAIVSEVRALSENRIRADAAASELQRRVSEANVTKEIISTISTQLGKLDTVITVHQGSLDQIWPRLRALDKNITILVRAMERLHPGENITIEEPQKF